LQLLLQCLVLLLHQLFSESVHQNDMTQRTLVKW